MGKQHQLGKRRSLPRIEGIPDKVTQIISYLSHEFSKKGLFEREDLVQEFYLIYLKTVRAEKQKMLSNWLSGYLLSGERHHRRHKVVTNILEQANQQNLKLTITKTPSKVTWEYIAGIIDSGAEIQLMKSGAILLVMHIPSNEKYTNIRNFLRENKIRTYQGRTKKGTTALKVREAALLLLLPKIFFSLRKCKLGEMFVRKIRKRSPMFDPKAKPYDLFYDILPHRNFGWIFMQLKWEAMTLWRRKINKKDREMNYIRNVANNLDLPMHKKQEA